MCHSVDHHKALCASLLNSQYRHQGEYITQLARTHAFPVINTIMATSENIQLAR